MPASRQARLTSKCAPGLVRFRTSSTPLACSASSSEAAARTFQYAQNAASLAGSISKALTTATWGNVCNERMYKSATKPVPMMLIFAGAWSMRGVASGLERFR